MKTSVLAASMLLIGATAMAAPAAQATKAPAKPAAAHKMVASHTSGTVEKYDAASKTLTVKHDGKEMQFTVADGASIMKGKDKADLSTATGMEAKIEYKVSGTNKTADKIELSAAKTAAKPAPKPTKK